MKQNDSLHDDDADDDNVDDDDKDVMFTTTTIPLISDSTTTITMLSTETITEAKDIQLETTTLGKVLRLFTIDEAIEAFRKNLISKERYWWNY